ncbi:hypothetical protein HaLaN_18670 [Haematococcus lacustris]|uniref:Uncharacterized protein n=1 Tax=Haematococcus lacustris TaxID=44745 RepID=A0A699ZF92_HAELA|nr:hypothetical protein HaLaN_18670 [Haematococcus lacustris]
MPSMLWWFKSFASPGVLVAEFIITSLAAGAILLT